MSRDKTDSQPNIQELDDINTLEWSKLSLTMAMRGMENEEEPLYTLSDITETF